MKTLLPIFFLALVATSAQAQNFPTGPDDPAYQMDGYRLVVINRTFESWDVSLEAAYEYVIMLANDHNPRDNIKVLDIWGGSYTGYGHQEFPGFFLYYAYAIKTSWYWKPIGDVGDPTGPGN